MTAAPHFTANEFGPWNPGIESPVPAALLPLCTIFRPENVYTTVAEARELRGLTGLDFSDIVAFRPERLALHELLIRVSADFSVPDGSKIEDLGINFRRITGEILRRYIEPQRAAIMSLFEARKRALSEFIAAELNGLFPARESSRSAETELVAKCEARGQADPDPLQRSACRALDKVVCAVLVRHGRMWGTRELIVSIATNMACNDFGSAEIGRLIEPWVMQAVAEGRYRLLPRQERPVVMNTKGASASGKSTIRPLQRRLAGDIGTSWSDFALISPDIWRKQLLDYGVLGAAYKYAGAFTGDELRIIDQKLDQYIALKAQRGHMSHLLIDRFRFDSFAPDSDVAGSNLLTRFGQIVYLFFMITPPNLLVERAWSRGLEVGRYKAVDDTLAHGVEAYSGMPLLFFTWIERTDKRVHFEFLDNSVSLGDRPRTVAFGWNDCMTVLDVKSMLAVERYRRVDINATSPEALFRDRALLAPEKNTSFLRECVQRFREVNFAEQPTGRVYLSLVAGSPVWADREALERAAADTGTRAGLMDTVPGALNGTIAFPDRPSFFDQVVATERVHTIGRWGAHAPPA
ncbi:MAG: hypothetical protein JWN13_3880 [Betaproteobacteria bacterium]|nr:hypothetical protein [Betaproteobacteria bacterium]